MPFLLYYPSKPRSQVKILIYRSKVTIAAENNIVRGFNWLMHKRIDGNDFLLWRRSRKEHKKTEKCQSCLLRQKSGHSQYTQTIQWTIKTQSEPCTSVRRGKNWYERVTQLVLGLLLTGSERVTGVFKPVNLSVNVNKTKSGYFRNWSKNCSTVGILSDAWDKFEFKNVPYWWGIRVENHAVRG